MGLRVLTGASQVRVRFLSARFLSGGAVCTATIHICMYKVVCSPSPSSDLLFCLCCPATCARGVFHVVGPSHALREGWSTTDRSFDELALRFVGGTGEEPRVEVMVLNRG